MSGSNNVISAEVLQKTLMVALFCLMAIIALSCHQITEFQQAGNFGVNIVRTSDFGLEASINLFEGARSICSYGNSEILVTSTEGLLYRINSETAAVDTSILIGTPSGSSYDVMARSPLYGEVYVFGAMGRILEINLVGNQVTDEFYVGPEPSDMCICPGYLDEMIFVDSDDRTIYKVSASSNSIKDQYNMIYGPVSVARFTQTDDLVAVACSDYSGTVYILNSQNFYFASNYETGSPCEEIVCFNSDTTFCVTHPSSGSADGGLTIGDYGGSLKSLTITGSPVAVCAHPSGNYCYVLSNVDGEAIVTVVDVADREIDYTFEVEGFPVDITTHRNGEYLLVLTVG